MRLQGTGQRWLAGFEGKDCEKGSKILGNLWGLSVTQDVKTRASAPDWRVVVMVVDRA